MFFYRVKTGNFDSLVDEKSENTVIPYKPSLPRMEFSSLGFSESFKSVSKPDGVSFIIYMVPTIH